MTGSGVTFTVDGAIATILLDRPDAGNAIDMSVADAMFVAARTCHANESIRCVMLTGAGRLFCVGGDLPAMRGAADRGAYVGALAERLHEAIVLLMTMQKPLVTLVNGPAAGAGMSLAIMGDIVLASRSATFTTAYGAVGLTPDGGMSWLLPRLVGLREAQRLLMTGERVTADRAIEIGLVSQVVEVDDLTVEGQALACRLAIGPTRALGGARALLQTSYSTSLEGQLVREAERIAVAARGSEAAEGITAFAERRTPDFPAATVQPAKI